MTRTKRPKGAKIVGPGRLSSVNEISEGVQVISLSRAAITANSCSHFNAKWIQLTVIKLFCYPWLLKTLTLDCSELFEKIYNSTDDVLAYLFVVFMSHEINKWFFSLETKQPTLSSFSYPTFNMEMELLFLCVKQYVNLALLKAVKTFRIVTWKKRPGWDHARFSSSRFNIWIASTHTAC